MGTFRVCALEVSRLFLPGWARKVSGQKEGFGHTLEPVLGEGCCLCYFSTAMKGHHDQAIYRRKCFNGGLQF